MTTIQELRRSVKRKVTAVHHPTVGGLKTKTPTLLVLLGLVAVWEVYVRVFRTGGDLYFPSPRYTLVETINAQDQIFLALRTTFTEIVAGFLIAVFTGIIVGIVLSKIPILRQALLPSLVWSYSLPHAIVAPLFIVWFGQNLLAIALFVAWFGFFAVMVNTMTGIAQVQEEFHQLGTVIGASDWQMLKKIELWAAFPNIISGVKVAVQQSIVGAIIAEFIATRNGLGSILVLSSNLAQTGVMFGTLILIMIVAILYFGLVSFILDLITPGSRGQF